MGEKTLRIAAMSDIHYKRTGAESLRSVFIAAAAEAQALVICGDLTDLGLAEEAELVIKDLAMLHIPIVAVLGNHDFHGGQQDELAKMFRGAGIHLLDGDAVEIGGVGFAGVKGFCGGFDRRMLEPWGENIMKAYVQEALDETLKLESALAKLRTPHRVAVLHYAPVQATVEGEPPEIFAFLGSSRLEDPINRYEVDLVLHGHAHHGSPAGTTRTGIPVYNVSMSLLSRTYPDRPPFRILEVPVE